MNTAQPTGHYFNPYENDAIDIKRYISLSLSNWYWFAITLFISLTISYGVNRYSEKIYTVSSTLLIKDNKMGGSMAGAESFIPGGDLFRGNQNLNNEMGILKSYTLNKRVVDSLPDFQIVYVGVGRRSIVERRQYMNSPFLVIPAEGINQPFNRVSVRINSETEYTIVINDGISYSGTMKFGERFSNEGFDFTLKLRDPGNFVFDEGQSNKYYFWFARLEAMANKYRSKLQVKPIDEDATIVTLTLSGPVAEQEVDYLNKLMDLYITLGLELKSQTADSTIAFIDRQLSDIFYELSLAEDELLKFRYENKLVDLSREGIYIQSRLDKYGTERTALVLQKKYYDYLSNYLKNRQTLEEIVSPAVMGITDPQLVRLVQDIGRMQQEKRQLSMNLSTDTKPITILEENITRLMSSLEEIVKGGLITIGGSLADVDDRLALVEAETEKLPSTEREMLRIQRKLDISNTVYNFLLEKRAEAGIAKASTVSDNRIIDRAHIYNRSQIKPKAKRNNMLAIIIGLFFPVSGILLIDYLNNKIIDKKDVKKGTDVPIIGYISHSIFKSEISVLEKPGSTLAESFRSVRTNLKFFTKEIKTPLIAVSSTISAEGKTFISINLASIIASLGKKVLLVGLDMRKPRIHKVLEVSNGIGISTYLTGSNSYKDVVQKTRVQNLYYAPSGPVPPNPAELIENEKMKEFFDLARKEFDYIIIDTPPLAIVTDALLIAPYVDMYMLVVRQRYTSKNTLELIQELYKTGTLKNMGIVINDISLSGYYGYGLRYGYYLGYGYSYGYNYYGHQGYSRYGYANNAKGYYTEE